MGLQHGMLNHAELAGSRCTEPNSSITSTVYSFNTKSEPYHACRGRRRGREKEREGKRERSRKRGAFEPPLKVQNRGSPFIFANFELKSANHLPILIQNWQKKNILEHGTGPYCTVPITDRTSPISVQ